MSILSSLQQAIDTTLKAISESRAQVDELIESTVKELTKLEADYEQLREECLDAIAHVEQLESADRKARQYLVDVNRKVYQKSEREMQKAYMMAQEIQVELSQWREREYQLRLRRDDCARRLKNLRTTEHQAEILIAKFNHMTNVLGSEVLKSSDETTQSASDFFFSMRLLQIQEEERRMLAEHLHDGVMQSLAAVSLRLQAPIGYDESAKSGIRESLSDVLSDLRRVVFDLRPPLLDDLGLVPTLRRYTDQWSRSRDLQVYVELLGVETALGATQKVTLFRAIQEGLRNVLEHASAKTVRVGILYKEANIEVRIVDDGKGLIGPVDWPQLACQGKTGLIIAKQRLEALGGTLAIDSGAIGTTLTLSLPWEVETNHE